MDVQLTLKRLGVGHPSPPKSKRQGYELLTRQKQTDDMNICLVDYTDRHTEKQTT